MVTSPDKPREIWIHALGAKAGGGLTYLESVLPELRRQLAGTGVRLVVLLPAPLARSLAGACEVHVMPLAAMNWGTRLLFDQLVLPLWLLRRRRAVLFCSGSFPPIVKPVPTSVLVRNAIYFEQEFLRREVWRRRVLLRMQAWLIRVAARGCVAIHYPSRYMQSLVEQDAPELERSGIVNYYGVREVMLRAREEVARPAPASAPAPVPTFLYVMNYTLQKNLRYLLAALVLAKDRGTRVRVLVTSTLRNGPRATFASNRALIEAHGLIESGYLEPVGPTFGEDLVRLYEQVDCCLFPSICESFGHPLVEAMALGKPIICADRPYAREICGDAAMYVDPRRPEDIVRLWERWPDLARNHTSIPRAALTARFSWSKHVSVLLESLLSRQPA